MNRRTAELLSEVVSTPNETVIADPPLTVETIDNHIYFYAQIDSDRALAATKQLRELESRLQWERLQRNLPTDHPHVPIWLHIQSPGGWVDASFSLADTILGMKTPVYTIVEGMAASGATLVSMAGKRRYITPNSFIMVHEATTWFWGRGSEMKDELKLMDDIKDKMVAFYVERSTMDEEEVRHLMDRRDNWFTPEESIARGMVDEIS